MKYIIIYLFIILFLLLLICYILYRLNRKSKTFLMRYFGTSNLKKVLENSKIQEEDTPKSLSSMEKFILPKIENDFKNLNINEIKSLVEEGIIYTLSAIEDKKIKDNKKISDEFITSIQSKIYDLKDDNIDIDAIKIHKTVIQDYVNNGKSATIKLASSLEFKYRKNGDSFKKYQMRVISEVIYVLDSQKIHVNKKNIGLNCPNCGAPIREITDHCKYCDSGLVDVVKRTWILNKISKY